MSCGRLEESEATYFRRNPRHHADRRASLGFRGKGVRSNAHTFAHAFDVRGVQNIAHLYCLIFQLVSKCLVADTVHNCTL